MNPAPWEVIDLYARRAICRKHRIELERRSGPLTNTGAPKWVRYDCPSRDLNGNARGYCKTGGWINEIFEEDAK